MCQRGSAIDCGGSGIEQPADKGELGPPLAVGQKPIMPNALEAVGQPVQQETADELGGVERHAFLCRAVSVVPPAEGDAALALGNQAAIGNRDPAGVAAQIGEHLPGACERTLDVHHPIDAAPWCKACGEGASLGEGGQIAPEAQLACLAREQELGMCQCSSAPASHAFNAVRAIRVGVPVLLALNSKWLG